MFCACFVFRWFDVFYCYKHLYCGQSEDEQVGRRLHCAVGLHYLIFVLSDCLPFSVVRCIFLSRTALFCFGFVHVLFFDGSTYVIVANVDGVGRVKMNK